MDFLSQNLTVDAVHKFASIQFAVLAFAVLIIAIFWQNRRQMYQAKPLLNFAERRLLSVLRSNAPRGLTVMCQVSYGEIMRCRSRTKFFRVNAKRADFVLMDSETNPVAVVEYQGTGHFGFTGLDKIKAKKADRIKRRALREAGIALIEVPAKYSIPILKNELQALSLGVQSTVTDRKVSHV